MKNLLVLCLLLLSTFSFAADDAQSAADAYQAKQWPEASALYKKLTEAEPSKPLNWYRLGYASRQLGKLDDAEAAFQQAIKLGAQPMLATVNLAAVQVLAGKKEEALAALEKLANNGTPAASLIEADTAFASLNAEPRFTKAVESMKEQAAPCKYPNKYPEYRQFDFWLGDWDVYGKTGVISGHSHEELIVGDCVLNENWTDATGGIGKSYNKYNASLKRWEQYWVDQYGSTTFYTGKLEGPNMVFYADSLDAAGKPNRLRMTFFPLSPDKVRQFGELSTDDGKTWTTTFDLTYVRHK